MGNYSTFVAIAALGVSGSAFAQCTCPPDTGTRLKQLPDDAQIDKVLRGNTVCVGSSPTWEAQEQHLIGGVLNDYKRGPGHPTDPTATVGSWSIVGTGGNATVNYTYGTTSYSYGVCSTASTASANQAVGFCPAGSGTATSGTLRIGAVGC